jgi:4-amino-4-deoxy-L-arabinose transferase-like glycosyltransferase
VLAIALWLVPLLVQALGSGQPEYRAYLDDLLVRQTAGRYTRSWDHHQPWWYFLATMPSMWIPTFLLLPWALPAWWRRLRRRDARYLLPLAWLALVLLFFSLPDGKRDVYILPALPMFCLALGPLLPGLLRRRDVQALLAVFTAVLGLALVLAASAVLLGNPAFEMRLIGDRGVTQATTAALAWNVLAMGSGGLVALLWLGWRRAHLALVVLLCLMWVLYGLNGYRLLNDSSSARGTMQRVGALIGPHAELGLVAWKEQNRLMADRPAADFGFKRDWVAQMHDALAWQAQHPQRRWLLVQEPAMLSCVERESAIMAGMANRRRWWLVPATAVTLPCRTTAQEVRQVRQAQGLTDDEQ